MSAAGTAALLPLPIVCPIAGAVLAPLAGRLSRGLPFLVALLAMAGATATLAPIARLVYGGNGQVVSHYLGHWGPVNGQPLGIALVGDPLGVMYASLVAVVGTLLLLAAFSELGGLGARENGGFVCLFLLLLAALIGSALTADLINLFVWFQVAALASYGLTGFFLERPIALEAAFKIIVLTSIAGFLVFVGATLFYRQHGALNMAHLHTALGTGVRTADLLALGLMFLGLATKAGLVPVHAWLPDAHTAAPGAVSALFSGLMVNLGIIGLARLLLQVFPSREHGHGVLPLLTTLGAVSAVLGALMALLQEDLKRVLAWDTISQLGILGVGFATLSDRGVAGATYHLLDHALFKTLLFLCAGAVVHSTGQTELSRLGGLARHRPFVTAAFTLGVLAIAGIPPLNGYASLGLIHEAVEKTDPVTFVALLLAQALTVAALGRAGYLAFYRRRTEPYENLEKPRAGMAVTLILLGGACVAFGVFPNRVLSTVAAPAASSLLHPDEWAVAVLSGRAGVPPLDVTFEYWTFSGLLIVASTVLAGVLIAWWAVRWTTREVPQPRALRALRALHSGSVNDYVAFFTVGLIATLTVLLA